MKPLLTVIAALLLSACAWAQEPATHPQDHPDMMAVHQQHMQEMKAQLDKMHAKLDEMKANLAKVKDPAARQQIQLDADLWAMMVSHMDNMQKMMAGPTERDGMGMHHEEMAGCCAGMKDQPGGMKCMQGMRHEGDKTIVPPDKQ
jgi:hypothetical protein